MEARRARNMVDARKLITGAALAALSFCATAGCIGGPPISVNKSVHLAGSAAVTAAVTLATKDPYWGIAAGAGVGLVREVYKVRTGGRCEWSSMAWDVAGIAIGSYTSRVIIAPHFIGYRIEF